MTKMISQDRWEAQEKHFQVSGLTAILAQQHMCHH